MEDERGQGMKEKGMNILHPSLICVILEPTLLVWRFTYGVSWREQIAAVFPVPGNPCMELSYSTTVLHTPLTSLAPLTFLWKPGGWLCLGNSFGFV